MLLSQFQLSRSPLLVLEPLLEPPAEFFPLPSTDITPFPPQTSRSITNRTEPLPKSPPFVMTLPWCRCVYSQFPAWTAAEEIDVQLSFLHIPTLYGRLSYICSLLLIPNPGL